MSRRPKQAAVVFGVILAAAQLIRPERANPAIDVSRTLQAHIGAASGLAPRRARARQPSLQRDGVAPVQPSRARVLAGGARCDGRAKRVNFSDWAAYRDLR